MERKPWPAKKWWLGSRSGGYRHCQCRCVDFVCNQLLCDNYGASYFSRLGLKESCLTNLFNDSHTGPNISTLLKEACADWKITDKDPALVTDNARNMIVAGHEVEMRPHLTCFAHTLNLALLALQVDTATKLGGGLGGFWGGGCIATLQVLKSSVRNNNNCLCLHTSSYKMFPPGGTAPSTCCSGFWSNNQQCLPLSCPGSSGRERRWTL